MIEGVDDRELRELHAKAYGPGGRLTDAEARRLEELQALARGTAAERAAGATPQAGGRIAVGTGDGERPPGAASEAGSEPSTGVDLAGDSSGAPLAREGGFGGVRGAASGSGLNAADGEGFDSGTGSPDDDADGATSAADDAGAGSDGAGSTARAGQDGRRGIRTRRWFPYAAVGLVLLIGFGIGFVVFGQSVIRSIALSLAVGAEQVKLEAEGDYDPGSITPLGQSHGATIWHATRAEGENQCLLLTVEDRSESSCIPNDQFDQLGGGLYASLNLPADDEGGVSGLNVTVVRDVHGDLAVAAQVWSPDEMWDWRSQYSEDELAIVDRIESETGVAGEFLQIVGYDGDRPVWQEFSGPSACVIVAVVGSVERACAQDASTPVVLEIANPDGTSTRYQVTTSDTRGPTLTIERASAPGADAAIDDRTEDVEP